MKNKHSDPYIVKRIENINVKLLDNNNEFHNSIGMRDASTIAKSAGLDLVCFKQPDGDELGFYKIIDFGKWKYWNSKNKKKQDHHSKHVTKEVRFSLVISDHDIEHKLKKVNKFIKEGDEVILTMRLKGRQKSRMKEAEEKLNDIALKCEDVKVISRKTSSGNITIRIGKNN